ncbi:uncharacterized protein LOC118737590 isoform X2 [Rhagoletis pomonella]|uniref:uncharacterized protein LOC118737590 isoform X2 n=1 Tax=Rhagoletis pomonella TaxID=28610 RepID=UPI0017866398|nr:uncharacterized protein LOC118737590 isoform X2 [Rhagoletis pomonella]
MEIDSSEEGNNDQFKNTSTHEVCAQIGSTKDSTNPKNFERRKPSFVWKYFRRSSTTELECTICAGSVSNKTSNLARHLLAAHDISRQSHQTEEEYKPTHNSVLGRPSRSFIWKYCTKEDCRYARCHLCKKLLYFGGGNTANLAKHLRRKHTEVISIHELGPAKVMEDSEDLVAEMSNQMDSSINNCDEEIYKVQRENSSDAVRLRKERKGSSYVWNYCDKLSRHRIRCKLCKKVMNFHGTANVITHLQRRHNIVGRVENEAEILNIIEDDNGMADVKEEPDAIVRRHRRSSASTSVVWKYCKRLGQDVVRCSFCKKNLSFQGTSNLQRHLHRMHGIVTRGRGFSGSEHELADIDENFIWEHCEHTDDGKIKCNMCNHTFAGKGFEEIRKHLTGTHSVLSNPPPPRKRRKQPEETCDDTDDYEYENEDDNWQRANEEFTIEYNDAGIKKDPTFDDIIEEDHAAQLHCDEDPFDPNVISTTYDGKFPRVTTFIRSFKP